MINQCKYCYKATHHKCECGKEIRKTSEYCNSCSKIHREGKPRRIYKPLKRTIASKWTSPRGSKQRKKLGLNPVDFSGNRGCNIGANA